MTSSEPIKIIADAKESRSGIIDLLRRMPGYEIEVCCLDSGDFLVGPSCNIERKSAGDFFTSILDGRLICQSKLLNESFDRVIYIIEGDLRATRHNFSQESVHGALSYLSVFEGVSVIPSRDIKETASLVATAARHSQQGLNLPSLRVGKPKDGATAKLFVLEGLPGVGSKRAREILAFFGTVENVFRAPKEEWLKMPGMGKTSVDKIFAVIHDI